MNKVCRSHCCTTKEMSVSCGSDLLAGPPGTPLPPQVLRIWLGAQFLLLLFILLDKEQEQD